MRQAGAALLVPCILWVPPSAVVRNKEQFLPAKPLLHSVLTICMHIHGTESAKAK